MACFDCGANRRQQDVERLGCCRLAGLWLPACHPMLAGRWCKVCFCAVCAASPFVQGVKDPLNNAPVRADELARCCPNVQVLVDSV